MLKIAPAKNPAGMINHKKFQKDFELSQSRKVYEGFLRAATVKVINKKGIIKGKFRLWNFT